MNVVQLAKKLRKKSASNLDMAEFIRFLNSESDVENLKAILRLGHLECTGPVLERIAELVPEDPKLYITLALWKYHHGLDNQALALLNRARRIIPHDQDVLRADVWFAYMREPDVLYEKCRILLDEYPNDEWGKEIAHKLIKNGEIRTMRTPKWNNPWEDLLNQR